MLVIKVQQQVTSALQVNSTCELRVTMRSHQRNKADT